MPEHAELALMANFINEKCNDLVFRSVIKNTINKQPFDSSKLPKKFKIKAFSRGKELQIHHIPINSGSPGEAEAVKLTITMGMSGNFVFKKLHDKESKWPMLIWYTDGPLRIDSDRLELIDHRRFAKWKFRDWNPDRGPDIVTEHKEFRKLIHENILKKNKNFKKPLCELLMNQSYFNGIGNYLLAEILGALNVNPFQSILDLKKKKVEQLLDLCYEKPCDAYVLGGGQLKDWKNQDNIDSKDFKSWMKVYQNKKSLSVVTNTGRNFWFNKKWEKMHNYAK